MRHYWICSIAALFLLTATPIFANEATTQNFMKSALKLENPSIRYDSQYTVIPYPNGDVASDRGVCSDVVIRAYRGIGIDLQARVHTDMAAHFSLYPKLWGHSKPDTNIDHRRVPNLRVFFARHGSVLPITKHYDDYKAGDLVTWNLKTVGSLPHIGIVTDKKNTSGHLLIMHNMGYGQIMQDMLFDYTITGHYRYGLD
jgi:uncharacterized protein